MSSFRVRRSKFDVRRSGPLFRLCVLRAFVVKCPHALRGSQPLRPGPPALHLRRAAGHGGGPADRLPRGGAPGRRPRQRRGHRAVGHPAGGGEAEGDPRAGGRRAAGGRAPAGAGRAGSPTPTSPRRGSASASSSPPAPTWTPPSPTGPPTPAGGASKRKARSRSRTGSSRSSAPSRASPAGRSPASSPPAVSTRPWPPSSGGAGWPRRAGSSARAPASGGSASWSCWRPDVDPSAYPVRQRAVLEFLLSHQGPLPQARVLRETGAAPPVLQSLAKKGLLRVYEEESLRDPFHGYVERNDGPLVLTARQQAAVDRVRGDLDAGAPGQYLLFGVTGSGKTQVYIELIHDALARGPHRPGAGAGDRADPRPDPAVPGPLRPAPGDPAQHALRRRAPRPVVPHPRAARRGWSSAPARPSSRPSTASA